MSPASESGETTRPMRVLDWCKCRCRNIIIANDRIFLAPPLITLGSSLAEIIVVFSITGFMAIDVIAVSAVCFSILLSLATLLFIRFDRLTILAFLMLSVSLLSSSTFLVICIERQTQSQPVEGLKTPSTVPETISIDAEPHKISANGSRHGSKITELMKTGTELRWIHQLQAAERCCGWWNFTDWIEENSLLESNKSFKYHSEPIHPPTKWMVSCCDRNLTQDHSNCRAETIYDDWHDIVQYLFQNGCGSLLDEKMDSVYYEFFKTSLGLTFWDLMIAIDLVVYTVWRKLRTKAHSGFSGRNGAITTEDDDVFT